MPRRPEDRDQTGRFSPCISRGAQVSAPARRLRVLFASAECAPFTPGGGLAEVAGTLPSALARLGHDVRVVIPWYPSIRAGAHWIEDAGTLAFQLGGRGVRASLGSSSRLPLVRSLLVGHRRHLPR